MTKTTFESAREMVKFHNRLRSLYNIGAYQVPELTDSEWTDFRDAPLQFFIRTGEQQQLAIWREVEKRQAEHKSAASTRELAEANAELLDAANGAVPNINDDTLYRHLHTAIAEAEKLS